MASSQQLSQLLNEQNALRTEMEDLFAQRAAITLQMKEIEERLHCIDKEIDRVESSESATPAQQFTQHPDEFLTDPTSDDIEDDNMEELEEESRRRISESPNSSSFHHNQPTDGGEKTKPQNEMKMRSNNPFGDLWSAYDRNQLEYHNTDPPSSNITKGNTLERYFARPKPPAASHPNHPSILPNSVPNRNNKQDSNNPQHPWTQSLYHHLHSTFNIPSFRDHQLAIINGTLSNRDIFVIMRTGGGKSLTYQLPALLEMESSKKVTIVISPLISLIRDQEEQMNAMYRGSAVSFTSGMGREEHTQQWARVRDANGGVALVFVTPEKVGKSGKFKGEMEKLWNAGRLGRFVIDEAHCATQWGHDFRPDYTKLGILKHHFPSVPLLAVTATASDRVRQDCCDILRLDRNHLFFRSTANRPNLTYMIKCKPDSKDALIKDMVGFIKEKHENDAGIIYTFSKKEADEVANALRNNGIEGESYHSDVSDSKKNQVHRSWMRNKTQVVVATIAFGLGINKPDVRFVLHHSLSKSLEAYYQESGRAGRDGKPANCVLYYTPKDVPRMLGMIHGEVGESAFWGMVKYGQAHGDDQVCRHSMLATLGETSLTDKAEELREQCTTTHQRDIGAHAKTATQVVNNLNIDGPCTLNQIVTKWRSKKDDDQYQFLKNNPPGNDLTKEECERTIVSLLLQDILHPNVVYTAYNTVCYLRLGPLAQKMMASENPCYVVDFPLRQTRKKSPKASATLAITNDDGWISPNNKQPEGEDKKSTNKANAKKRKGSNWTTNSQKASKPTKQSTSKAAAKKKSVVEINSSSSESSDDEFFIAKRAAVREKRNMNVIGDDSSSDESEQWS